MNPSPQQQIESIVRSLEEKGSRAAPVMEATDLATSHPEAVGDLAVTVMRRFPKGGTFLTERSVTCRRTLARTCRSCFGHPRKGRWEERCGSVRNRVRQFAVPSTLHSHLDRIFCSDPNARSYYECYPWRESGDQHLAFLRKVIENRVRRRMIEGGRGSLCVKLGIPR